MAGAGRAAAALDSPTRPPTRRLKVAVPPQVVEEPAKGHLGDELERAAPPGLVLASHTPCGAGRVWQSGGSSGSGGGGSGAASGAPLVIVTSSCGSRPAARPASSASTSAARPRIARPRRLSRHALPMLPWSARMTAEWASLGKGHPHKHTPPRLHAARRCAARRPLTRRRRLPPHPLCLRPSSSRHLPRRLRPSHPPSKVRACRGAVMIEAAGAAAITRCRRPAHPPPRSSIPCRSEGGGRVSRTAG